MLHVIELHIADHANWGQTIARDVVLPSRINRIKSLFASAQMGRFSFIIPTIVAKIDEQDTGTFFDNPFNMPAFDPLIGSLSVSVNNSDIIAEDLPIYAQAKMKSSIKRNHIVLETPYMVRTGSTMRVIMEEKLANPFYNKNLLLYSNDVRGALVQYQDPNADTHEVENDYTVKLYIEYD